MSCASPFLLPHTPEMPHNGLRGMFHEGGGSNCGLCAEQELSALLSQPSADDSTSDDFCDSAEESSKTAAFVG